MPLDATCIVARAVPPIAGLTTASVQPAALMIAGRSGSVVPAVTIVVGTVGTPRPASWGR